MKQIFRTRGNSKTLDAIKICIDNDAVLVTPYDVDHVVTLAWSKYNTKIRVIRFQDFLRGALKGCHNEKFVIDDADACLHQLVQGNNLLAITMNVD